MNCQAGGVIFVTSNGNKQKNGIMKLSLSLVNTLAAQLRRNQPETYTNRSNSMQAAYRLLARFPGAQLLVFRKISGEVTRRVVLSDWSQVYTAKGGRSTNKPGQLLFADLGKVPASNLEGPSPIISTYAENILSLA